MKPVRKRKGVDIARSESESTDDSDSDYVGESDSESDDSESDSDDSDSDSEDDSDDDSDSNDEDGDDENSVIGENDEQDEDAEEDKDDLDIGCIIYEPRRSVRLRTKTKTKPLVYIDDEMDEDEDEDVDEEDVDLDVLTNVIRKENRGAKQKSPFTTEELLYLRTLDATHRVVLMDEHDKIQEAIMARSGHMPIRFRITSSPMNIESKALVMDKYNSFLQMNDDNGEYHKMRMWMDAVCRLPLGKLSPLPVNHDDGIPAVATFLQQTRQHIDNVIYGHALAKEQILRIMAQWMSKPGSRGYAIGIHGDKGVGKTSLVKDGIAKALGLPFGFISLGGATDASFLEGHSYTYEGSTYGKIAEVIMKSNCMNPVIFFDELDKVSSTQRGEEINNVLMHLTDSSQNEHFSDRYFGEVELDLSRSLLIFSYNDESLINPILKDRMVTIHAKGYQTHDKVMIAHKHLLPGILSEYSLQPSDIIFSDEIIHALITRVPQETGVRNLKRGIECIVGWVNMLRYLPNPSFPITFPYHITDAFVHKHLSKNNASDIPLSLYT